MSMSDPEFDEYLESSVGALQQKQDQLERDFQFGHHANWSYDGNHGLLCFADESGRPVVKADVVQIGSYSTKSRTWKWAWSNPTVPESQRQRSVSLCTLYDRTGFDVFRNEACEADEQMAWEFAAMSVEHFGALGCYRGLAEHLWVFFAIINAQPLPEHNPLRTFSKSTH